MHGADIEQQATSTHEASSDDENLPTRQTVALKKIAQAIDEWTQELRALREALNRLSSRIGRGEE
jgi:hypothetical protein